MAKRISDKILLLTGLVVNFIMIVILLAYMPNYKHAMLTKRISQIDYLVFICTTLCATVFSLPLIVVSSISLLSKITSSTNQGLTQGIRRSFVDIACIIGPLWAGTNKQINEQFKINLVNFECISANSMCCKTLVCNTTGTSDKRLKFRTNLVKRHVYRASHTHFL